MPFNSDTYHANKFKRLAWEGMASARDIKARAERGEARQWEVAKLPHMVQIARSMMRTSVVFRQISNERKRQRRSAIFG
jgi:hypothetical protein